MEYKEKYLSEKVARLFKKYLNEEIAKLSPKELEINRIFHEMRKMVKTEEIYWYSDNWHMFIKQGEFMKNFTDNFEKSVPYDDYFPTYQKMDNDQLRTYFTWRTEARRGNLKDTYISYVICYIYELINEIGTEDCEDTIQKLVAIWLKFKRIDTRVRTSLIDWIRDYYILNSEKLKHTFPEYLGSYYNKVYDFDVELLKQGIACNWENLNAVELFSSFKITDGAFYKKGDKVIIEECACFVLKQLEKYFKLSKTDFKKLFLAKRRNKLRFYDGAIHLHIDFYKNKIKIDEISTFKSGSTGYRIEMPDIYKYRNIVGYIMKYIELEMRRSFGLKHLLKVPSITRVIDGFSEYSYYNSDDLSKWKQNMLNAIESPDFEVVIKASITEYLKKSNLVIKNGKLVYIEPVKIDLRKLKEIEKDHIETAEKLISEDEAREELPIKSFRADLQKNNEVENTKRSTKTDKNKENKDVEDKALSDFEKLSASLSEKACELLLSIVEGRDFSNPELIVEEINEKALDIIGDNLIEYVSGKPQIYAEYLQQVTDEMFSL